MPRRTPKSAPIEPADGSELSRQLLRVQEEERRRISRELHDETGQALMVLRFQLEMLAGDMEIPQHRNKIQEPLELLDRTIEGLRRTIARLSPRVLEELGLVTGIRREAQLVSRHTGIRADLELPEESEPLNHEVEVALYRSVQEALHNVAKHSRAKRFTIKLRRTANKVAVEIEDDGIGFSPRRTREGGFGLTGMRERAAALGGVLTIRSGPDKGTRVRLVLPLGSGGQVDSTVLESAPHRVSAA